MTQQPNVQAWVFPGQPACSASTEIADGRTINVLKPQYYTLQDNGTLTQITDSLCNGYIAANAALVKAHSQRQFVTISGSIAGIQALADNASLVSACIQQLTAFFAATQFTGGIEIDVEGFGSWTQQQYSAYKGVLTTLGDALHTAGLKLMVDGPAIINTTYQGYYQWKYEDFNSLPVDYVVAMCYDFQDDNGAGTPVASLQNITACCSWMKSKITDQSRIVIGINSYGYMGKSGSYTVTEKTYQQSTQLPGFSTATRDPASGEMMWTQNGTSYDYSNSTTLNSKVAAVLATGLTQASIWHIGGGNAWPDLSSLPQPDPALTSFNAAYPKFDAWYKSSLGTD